MRSVAVPSVTWASSFTSWGIIAYVLLYVFLPRRVPEIEIPLRVGEDAPPPASMGTWTSLDGGSGRKEVKWFLDPHTMSVSECARPSRQTEERSTMCSELMEAARQQLLAKLMGNQSSSVHTILPAAGGETAEESHKHPLETSKPMAGNMQSQDHRTMLSKMSLAEFFDVWPFGPLPDDETSPSEGTTTKRVNEGFLYVFGKTTYVAHDENSVVVSATGKVPSSSSPPQPDAADHHPSKFAVEFRVLFREGLFVTSPLAYLRFFGGMPQNPGGARASNRPSFVVFGTTPPTFSFSKGPLSTLTDAGSNATIDQLVTQVHKREVMNASAGTDLFKAALIRNAQTSLDRLVAVNRSTSSKGGHKETLLSEKLRAARVGLPPLEQIASTNCLWYGTIRTRMSFRDENDGSRNAVVGTEASSSAPVGVALVEEDLRHNGIVEGNVFSTCGDHVRWTTTEKQYEHFISSWNYVLILALVPSVLLAVGLLKQSAFIRNSRARTLRLSRATLIVLVVYLLMAVCYVEILWITMPTNIKMANVCYTILFFDVMCALHIFSTVDTEYRRANNQTGRAPLLLVYLGCSAVGNLLPLAAKTALFTGPALCVGGVLLWLPQLLHLFSGKGRDGVILWLLISASLVPLSLDALFLLGPLLPEDGAAAHTTVVSRHPTPFVVCMAAAGVVMCTLTLHVCSKYGLSTFFPKWMMPWVHEYHLPREKISQFAGLAEDPDCSICGESFEHPDDLDSVTVGDEVWLTPCKHLFHRSCLSRWMEQRMDCPLCRKVLPEP